MEPSVTSDELRSAARQATTLALMSFTNSARESLLTAADRLLAEADALEKVRLQPLSRKRSSISG
jgi:hypothetical protein